MRALAEAEYSKRLVLLRAVVDEAAGRGHPDARAVADAFSVLAELQRYAPRAVRDAVAHPAIGPWALGVLDDLVRAVHRAEPGRLAAVAAVAAINGRVPLSIPVPVADERVILPSLGAAMLPGAPPGGTAVVTTGPRGSAVTAYGQVVRIPGDPHTDDGPWRGMRRVTIGTIGTNDANDAGGDAGSRDGTTSGYGTGGHGIGGWYCADGGHGTGAADGGDGAVTFLVDDLDPSRLPSGPPLAPRLSAGRLAGWRAVTGLGWRLLTGIHREAAAEVAAGVRVLVPLRTPPGGTASATSASGFGCVALSRPHGPLALAEALAHEVQHVKLAGLNTMFPLVTEPDGERFYAPWRADPRPAGALLQGAYAHLGVAGFWRRQWHAETGRATTLHAQTEFARWREAAWQATDVLLDSGRLTGQGERLAAGMLTALDAMRREAVPPEAARRAARLAEEHRARSAGREVSR